VLLVFRITLLGADSSSEICCYSATYGESNTVVYHSFDGYCARLIVEYGSQEDSITRDGGGIVDYCRLNHITIQAWSPFQKGFQDRVFFNSQEYPALNEALDSLAQQYRVSPLAIASAWITRHPAGMQVVLGTTNPERVALAAAGSDIVLTRAQWYGLIEAAGHNVS
jgi:predicted oxidoreductase